MFAVYMCQLQLVIYTSIIILIKISEWTDKKCTQDENETSFSFVACNN